MDIKGWDSISMTSIETINERLHVQMKLHPISFSYNTEKFRITGEFDAWQIVKGGSEQHLHVKTPIKMGEFTILEENKKYDLTGICPILAVHLTFMNSEQNQNSYSNLEFNFSQKNNNVVVSSTDPITSIITITDTTKQHIPAAIEGLLKHHLPEIFNVNKDKFLFILGQIKNTLPIEYKNNIENAQKEPFIPQKMAYVYLPGGSVPDYLAVLTSYSSEFRPTSTNLEIDTSIFDTDNDTYFVLSEVMLLKSIIMPLLYKAFPKSAQTNFIYDGRPDSSPGQIGISERFNCTLNDDNKTEISITDLSINIENNKIVIHIQGEHYISQYDKIVDFSLDFDSTIEYNHKLDTLSFKTDKQSIKNTYNIRESLDILSKLKEFVEFLFSPSSLLITKIIELFMGDSEGATIANLEKNTLTETFHDTANVPFIIKSSGDTFQINVVDLEQAFCVKGKRKVKVN